MLKLVGGSLQTKFWLVFGQVSSWIVKSKGGCLSHRDLRVYRNHQRRLNELGTHGLKTHFSLERALPILPVEQREDQPS